MFIILLCVVLLLIGQGVIIYYAKKNSYNTLFDYIMPSVFYWLCVPFVAFFICLLVVPMTGGLMRGYSEGIREGYITKISDKGLIWKTYEAQIQVGTGEMAELQAPFAFSIPEDNKELYNTIQKNLGKKVNIEYTQWLLMPYQIGESGIELTKVTSKK